MRGGDPRPPDGDVHRRGPSLRAPARRTISSPGRSTPYDVRLDGELVWPPEDGRPPPVVHTRNHEPSPARLRLVPRRRPAADRARRRLARGAAGARSRRALDVLEAAPARRGRVAGRAPAARRPGVRGRGVAGDARVHPGRRGTDVAPGEQIADFEEYTQPLPRVVVGPGHPLAALDRADGDDLRRPRRARRLEHLVALGPGDAAEALVGGADHRRLHVVLDLPAPRQSLAARARRGDDACRACRATEDAGPLLRELAHSGTASPRQAAGRTTATSATRACSCSTRGRHACSRTDGADDRRRGVGLDRRSLVRRVRPYRRSRARCRSSLPHGIHHLQAWNEALCAGRWGGARANLSERLRRAVDLEHWAAFNRSFEQLCDWLRHRRARQRGTSRRPRRSCCSAATCTTARSARSSSVPDPVAASTSSSARRSGTRCHRRERRIVGVTGSRARRARSSRALARLAGVPRPVGDVAARSAGPPSRTRSGELVLDGRSAPATVRRSPQEGEDSSGSSCCTARRARALETRSYRRTPILAEGVLDERRTHTLKPVRPA